MPSPATPVSANKNIFGPTSTVGRSTAESVNQQLQESCLVVIIWFAVWSDQSKVHVFGGDLGRAARGKEGVGKFLATVRLRKPPRGSLNTARRCAAERCGSRWRRTATAANHCQLGITRVPRGTA